jgi:hypothetical protein
MPRRLHLGSQLMEKLDALTSFLEGLLIVWVWHIRDFITDACVLWLCDKRAPLEPPAASNCSDL